MASLLLHHTHTDCSNSPPPEVPGPRPTNHHGDYVGLAERLPAGLDVVITKTEHWHTTAAYYDDLAARVGRRGGEYRQFERHACFELGGSRAVVLNGVEASVRGPDSHVTLCGLPIGDEDVYYDLSEPRLYEAAREALWAAPAHPRIPQYSTPADLLRRFCETATHGDEGFTAALGYTTGYTPFLNRLAQGRTTGRRPSVPLLADRHGLPLIPELDWHVALAPRLRGAGLLPDGVVDAYWGGETPVEPLLGTPVLGGDDGSVGLSYRAFLESFPDALPANTSRLLGPLVPRTPTEFRTTAQRWLDRLTLPAPAALPDRTTTDPETSRDTATPPAGRTTD